MYLRIFALASILRSLKTFERGEACKRYKKDGKQSIKESKATSTKV